MKPVAASAACLVHSTNRHYIECVSSKLTCRFHDLRHSAVTRLLEGGVSFPIVASLLGWSPSTSTKMAKRYGHIGNAAHRQAVAALDPITKGAPEVGTDSGTVTESSDHARAAND